MSAQLAADLRAAAEVLRRDGWTQGDYVGMGGCRCLVGAVTKVLGGDDGEGSVPSDNSERLNEVRRAINVQVAGTSDYWFDVIDWNDDESRTADEVIATLLAAADAAEAQS